MKKISNSIDFIAETITQQNMGIPTGFKQLDKTIRGLTKGELHLIAARPSMGKSALMLDMTLNIAPQHNVGVFSLEMSEQLCVERMLANKQGVSLIYDLKPGKVKVDETVKGNIEKLNLWINDSTGISALDIYNVIETSGVNFDVVFIDYLQLIKTAREDSRYREIDALCQNLRDIAKKKNLAMVVLAQLNRNVDDRPDHRPRLSDLRESGGIEQISDKILLLYRPSYYPEHEENKRKKEEIGDDSEAYIIVAKNRNGKLEDVPVVWYAPPMHFESCKFELENGGF